MKRQVTGHISTQQLGEDPAEETKTETEKLDNFCQLVREVVRDHVIGVEWSSILAEGTVGGLSRSDEI